jgi:hypothetical protein
LDVGESDEMWKEVIAAHFQVVPRHLPERFQKEKVKNLSEYDVILWRNEAVTYR